MRREKKQPKRSSFMWEVIFSLGFIIILLSTEPLPFKALTHVVRCVCGQTHSGPTGDTVQAAAAWRKATTVDAKHPKHTRLTQTHFFLYLSLAPSLSSYGPHILFPQRGLVFQLPCHYRDYYSQIDPSRFNEKANVECPKIKGGNGGELQRGTWLVNRPNNSEVNVSTSCLGLNVSLCFQLSFFVFIGREPGVGGVGWRGGSAVQCRSG